VLSVLREGSPMIRRSLNAQVAAGWIVIGFLAAVFAAGVLVGVVLS
jgi:hypothetical protein